jgi:ankyrin repeat protein
MDDVALERKVRASMSPLSSPLREISAESVSSAPSLDESGRDDSKEVVSKEAAACFKAAKVGNVRKVQAALESGMVLITARNNRNETLLHTAARYGQHELVTLLLSKGADAAAVDAKHRMPAQLAARHTKKNLESQRPQYTYCKRGEFLTFENGAAGGGNVLGR